MRKLALAAVLAYLAVNAQATTTCDVVVTDQGGRSVPSPTFTALHYPSQFRIYVKTTTPDCRWSLDVANAPSWISFQVADGTYVPRLNFGFTGNAIFDVRFEANSGYARSGHFTIHAPKYDIRLFVDQDNRKGLCLHTPVSTDSTESAHFGEGEFLLLLRRWGGNKVPQGPPTIYHLADSSGCPADGILFVTTKSFAGATITTTGVYQTGQPIIVTTPSATPNSVGEGAVFGLRGNGGNVGPSAIGAIILPRAASLPVDLRITWQGFLPSWAVFASTGGVIEMGGSVTRPTTDPKRRCAFDPSLYTVVASTQDRLPWVYVATDMTRCLGGNPDKGVLALVARPNTNTGSPRYAIIYDPWGWATMIVQAPGQ